MFDVKLNSRKSTNINFNAVSGTLLKSCSESKITRFHMKSKRADCFFNLDKPKNRANYNSSKEIVVLQVMLCGDQELLVEYVEKEKESNE